MTRFPLSGEAAFASKEPADVKATVLSMIASF